MKTFKLTTARSKELARQIRKLEMKSSRAEKRLKGGIRGVWNLYDGHYSSILLIRNKVIVIPLNSEFPEKYKNRGCFSNYERVKEARDLMQEIFKEEKQIESIIYDCIN